MSSLIFNKEDDNFKNKQIRGEVSTSCTDQESSNYKYKAFLQFSVSLCLNSYSIIFIE